MRNLISKLFSKKNTGVPKMENPPEPKLDMGKRGWEEDIYDPMTIKDSVQISLRNTKWNIESLENKIEQTKKYLDSWQKCLDSELKQLENYNIQKQRFEDFLNN